MKRKIKHHYFLKSKRVRMVEPKTNNWLCKDCISVILSYLPISCLYRSTCWVNSNWCNASIQKIHKDKKILDIEDIHNITDMFLELWSFKMEDPLFMFMFELIQSSINVDLTIRINEFISKPQKTITVKSLYNEATITCSYPGMKTYTREQSWKEKNIPIQYFPVEMVNCWSEYKRENNLKSKGVGKELMMSFSHGNVIMDRVSTASKKFHYRITCSPCDALVLLHLDRGSDTLQNISATLGCPISQSIKVLVKVGLIIGSNNEHYEINENYSGQVSNLLWYRCSRKQKESFQQISINNTLDEQVIKATNFYRKETVEQINEFCQHQLQYWNLKFTKKDIELRIKDLVKRKYLEQIGENKYRYI